MSNAGRGAFVALFLGVVSTAMPAHAQQEIFGYWGHIGSFAGYSAAGPQLGDYEFLSLNADGLSRAASWDPANQQQPERQCFPHAAAWTPFGPTPLLLEDGGDYIRIQMQSNEVLRRIWMDGRAHPPPYALHTWRGFSTGEWIGDTLKITTTHTKQGFLRRNGVPHSDRAVVTEYITRHGDYLTDVVVVEDPVYLTEPLVREQTYRRLPDDTEFLPYPCEQRWPRELGPEPFHFTKHYLPGENPAFDARDLRPARRSGGDASEGRRGAASPPGVQLPDFGAIDIETLHVAGTVHMLVGAGGNIAVSVGEDGVLVVDSQVAPLADRVVAAIRELSAGPIRYLINTHYHPDHVGGNARLAEAGATIIAHDDTHDKLVNGAFDDRTPDPSDRIPGAPPAARPETTIGEPISIDFNGEQIDVIPVGPAHTAGDLFVFFRGSNVLHTGDVLTPAGLPVIDRSGGGSFGGLVAALNRALDLATTAPGFLSGQNNEPGAWPDPSNGERTDTIIIPGHGRLYDEADLVEYRDMVVIIRDRIEHLMEQGMSLEQVVAADPTLGWNTWYGSDTPPFTTERFIATVYDELNRRSRR